MKKIPKNIWEDLRAEVVAAQFVDDENDIENIEITPRGIFKRGFKKDIAACRVTLGKDNSVRAVQLEVNRVGLYDLLPEGIFHEHHKQEDLNDIQQKSKRLRQEEQTARRFFLPFDQAFNQQRLLIELEERKELLGFSEDRLKPAFLKFWELNLDDFTPKQVAILCYLLPNAAKIAGNLTVLPSCYQAVLGIPVSFEKKSSKTVFPDRNVTKPLGEMRLASDFILSQGFTMGNTHLYIKFGPIPETRIPEFLPAGKATKVISYLNEYFIPFDWDVSMACVIAGQHSRFILGDELTGARLDYTTTI